MPEGSCCQSYRKPFFHYIPFIAPHFPLHALPEDIEKYRDKYLGRLGGDAHGTLRTTASDGADSHNTLCFRNEKLDHHTRSQMLWKNWDQAKSIDHCPGVELNDEQRRFQATKMAIHAAMVDRMDREIGRIIAQLKAMNAFENNVIFFASDNGASAEIMVRNGGHNPQASPGSAATYLWLGLVFSSACNTPHRRHKTWVHEGGISTPLIVHWPAGIQAKNELRHTPAHVIDVVPTYSR